jgi:hypothetical protein
MAASWTWMLMRVRLEEGLVRVTMIEAPRQCRPFRDSFFLQAQRGMCDKQIVLSNFFGP